MTPEQAMGERTIDARSDVHALIAVTCAMLAGGPPFTRPNVQVIVAKALTEEPEASKRHTSTRWHCDVATCSPAERPFQVAAPVEDQ